MKKLTPKRLPRKLVLRGEAIAQLTPTQLDHVAGGDSMLGNCNHPSTAHATCTSANE